MVSFRKITEENFQSIIDMKEGEGKSFVASTAKAIAQAWLYYEEGDVHSFAIYNDETAVGFMQLEENKEEGYMIIWRMLIDSTYVNKGYGQEAIRMITELIKESRKYKYIELDCASDNLNGMHVYKKCGFIETGEMNHGSIVLRYQL